jgi:hypothetical protein
MALLRYCLIQTRRGETGWTHTDEVLLYTGLAFEPAHMSLPASMASDKRTHHARTVSVTRTISSSQRASQAVLK